MLPIYVRFDQSQTNYFLPAVRISTLDPKGKVDANIQAWSTQNGFDNPTSRN